MVDESENLGVVLIGVNNPHLAEEEVDQVVETADGKSRPQQEKRRRDADSMRASAKGQGKQP